MQTVLQSLNSKGATGKFRSTSHHLWVVWWLCMHAAFALPLDIPSKSLYWDYHESQFPILHVGTSGLKLTSLHAMFSPFNLSLLAAVKLLSCDLWNTQAWVGKSSTFSLQATNPISACHNLSEPLPIRRSVSFMHSVSSHMLRRCNIWSCTANQSIGYICRSGITGTTMSTAESWHQSGESPSGFWRSDLVSRSALVYHL